MTILKHSLLASLLMVGFHAQADDISVLLHGATIHTRCSEGVGPKAKTCDLEGFNPGIGVEWTFLGSEQTGKLSLRSGFYHDSYRETAVYAGATYRKEWDVSEDWRLGAGLMAGYLDGSGTKGLAVLPIGIVSYQSYSLEVGFAPKTSAVPGRGHSGLITFMLRKQF
ncbi:hypothetical protein D3C87_892480 [compost metagenome]